MTTLDSSSAGESSMDDYSEDRRRRVANKSHSLTTAAAAANKRRPDAAFGTEGFNEDDCDFEGDAEIWSSFTGNFREVQSVLDRNRLLIQQVNENHQSRIPDNLVKNVALIQEINGNISKVVSLYSDLSTNFSSVFHQRNSAGVPKNNLGDGDNLQGLN